MNQNILFKRNHQIQMALLVQYCLFQPANYFLSNKQKKQRMTKREPPQEKEQILRGPQAQK